MVDLIAARAVRPVPLFAGVSVEIRPPTPDELVDIRADVREALKDRPFKDETARDAARQVAFTRAVALRCIVGWTGVTLGDVPAAVGPDTVAALLGIEAAADALWSEFVLPVVVLAETEKKTSANGPRGIGAAAGTTAGAVPPPAAPAPAAGGSTAPCAPTASTPP